MDGEVYFALLHEGCAYLTIRLQGLYLGMANCVGRLNWYVV
jgi:hypothetical protein